MLGVFGAKPPNHIIAGFHLVDPSAILGGGDTFYAEADKFCFFSIFRLTNFVNNVKLVIQG